MASNHSQAPYLISQGIFDSIKSFKEFEQKVSALFETNTKAQGDAFEIFVEAYLLTQAITQCAETWLVGSIPVEVREELNLPNDSKGIDGVFKSTSDVLVPYQVKFRSNRPALGFNEVAPFLGITEKAVDRLLITNCDSIAIDVKNRTGIRSLRGVDFDQLTEEDFTVIENWLKAKPAKRAALVPDPYQVEALASISNHLESQDRGSVVMACGTGKTLVALWAVEQSKAKSILVLLPSLTLLQQTLSEWSAHNSWGKDFSYLCVCSDPSVNLKNDEIEIDPTDVPFRIDTDPEIVRSYIAQDNGKTKIVFSTYQSSQVVSQATKGDFEFDIGVFDEAHKTTGAADGRFALALKDENISIKKRLFFTATPKHYDISKRDKDGEFKFVSMDDESVYGKRAYTLTFGDAASKGIICPYKVVITLIDKQQIDNFSLKNGITLVDGDKVQAKWVASQIAVSSAIKHTNASKIITFHSRVTTASAFASDEVFGIRRFVEDFEVFHVHGKQKSNERKDTINKFRNVSRSIITNAKCLTEGIDVPAVDMVAFVDPRHSVIDIAQAVGRAMRKPRGGDKKVGYIVVPIFAEDASKQSIEEAIKSERFDDVALVLNALLEQDEELAEIIKELKQEKGEGKVFNPKRFQNKVEVIGPLIRLDELTKSIFVEVLDRIGVSWDEWLGRLIKFQSQLGHCRVPIDYNDKDGYKLGFWVSNQRLKKNKLTEARIQILNDLGFVWDPHTEQWEEGFSCLVQFKERESHCRVPRDHIEIDFSLGSWVGRQRQRSDQLSEDRIQRLNELGFVWDPYSEQWEEGLSYLETFKERENHCRVSRDHIENDFPLGSWIKSQRNRKDKLTEARIQILNDLGFVWDPHTEQWEEGFSCLVQFKEREGHCRVPLDHIEIDFSLGSWVSTQRTKKDKLTEDRLKRLNELGFVWDFRTDQWEEGFSCLVKFKEREGHISVSQKLMEADFPLGAWVNTQRIKKNKLTEDRIKRLNDLDFIWDVLTEQWEEGYRYLVKFKDREGHCNVPSNYNDTDGYKLGIWITSQRARKDKLTEDRIKRLVQLGFVLDPRAGQWEEGFSYVVKFKEREGHCSVQKKHVEADGFPLGTWVNVQRARKDKLTEDRLKRLNELGFVWHQKINQWEEGFSYLERFQEREGHCRVPRSFSAEDGYRLGSWISNQRTKKDELTAERIKRLDDIGFAWSVKKD
jgi:superfamily II DNA or RNA helicase